MTMRAAFASNGHAVLQQGLPLALLDELRTFFERHFELEGSDRLSVSQFNVRDISPLVMEVVRTPCLLSVCQELLSTTRIRLWQEQVIIKPPRHGSESGWHQDFSYWPMQVPTAITCWIPLHDVDTQTGCLRFFSGSHLWGTEPSVLPRQKDDIMAFGCATGHDAQVTDEPMRKGDCSFHNGLVFHGATANTSSRYRIAFKAVYMVDGTRYRTQSHGLTKDCGFQDGDPLSGSIFPLLSPQ